MVGREGGGRGREGEGVEPTLRSQATSSTELPVVYDSVTEAVQSQRAVTSWLDQLSRMPSCHLNAVIETRALLRRERIMNLLFH